MLTKPTSSDKPSSSQRGPRVEGAVAGGWWGRERSLRCARPCQQVGQHRPRSFAADE
jgi:hypothetical protein